LEAPVDAEERFREFLRERGLRFTRERKAVLREVMAVHGHFEAYDIAARLRKKGKRVSQTSVYRTLPLLIESGIVRKTPCEDMKARFEHVFGHTHHDHLVCLRCGKVIEFRNDGIEKLQKDVARRKKFAMVGHRLIISGYCSRCR
jgi:Fur family ferric uptake transcriptional regulator